MNDISFKASPKFTVQAQSCAVCRFAWFEGKELVCRRNPPTVTVLMVPAGPLRPGQLMPQQMVTVPMVLASHWCGEFEASVQAGIEGAVVGGAA